MEKRKSGMVVVIFSVITVVAIVLVVVLRSMLNRNEGEEMDVSNYADRGITKAYLIADEGGMPAAYDVFVTVPGYKSDIETKVRIEKGGEEVLEVQILSQDETPELGGKITEVSFLNQFQGKTLPLSLSGQNNTNNARNAVSENTENGGSEEEKNGTNSEGSLALSGTGEAETKQPGQQEKEPSAGENAETAENTASGSLGEAVQRMDGVYRAEGKEFGGNNSQVTMVIENGTITELHWDSFDAEGNGKRALSLQGKYTMTEDGLLWADQADAVQNYVIEHQSLNGLTTNEEGKTDVISGVSISISSFKELVKECLAQATVGSGNTGDSAGSTGASGNNGSTENGENGNGSNTQNNTTGSKTSEIDGISGATISSAAVVTAVQTAYEFVMEQEDQ